MSATNTMPMTEFRERLWDCYLKLQRVRMDEARVSQSYIAREMKARGVSITQGAISMWMRGDSTPGDLQTYVALAEALSWGERGTGGWVDPGWLAFGDKSNAPPPEFDGGWTPIPQPS